MAADNHNSWVEYDVAIAVIGKMIAEQNRLRDDLVFNYSISGFVETDEEVQFDEDYIRYTARMNELFDEIDMIYKGKNLECIFDKVKNEYAPAIRERYGVAQKPVGV
ncbi:MAG: hypothetical protein EAZ91_23875 [Cytophagales bacterium]|nr:MAG: hypothetical protein EAZ91_23875 [Cytophagales bacterium]